MRKALVLVFCVVFVITLASCGVDKKYSSIINNLDNGNYDAAIEEIKKMKGSSGSNSSNNSDEADKDVAPTIEGATGIVFGYNYDPQSKAWKGDVYQLYRVSDHCSFKSTKFKDIRDSVACDFAIEKYDDLLKIILKGDRSRLEPTVDSDGKWGYGVFERVVCVYFNNENSNKQPLCFECSNMDEVEAYFLNLEKVAKK